MVLRTRRPGKRRRPTNKKRKAEGEEEGRMRQRRSKQRELREGRERGRSLERRRVSGGRGGRGQKYMTS